MQSGFVVAKGVSESVCTLHICIFFVTCNVLFSVTILFNLPQNFMSFFCVYTCLFVVFVDIPKVYSLKAYLQQKNLCGGEEQSNHTLKPD